MACRRKPPYGRRCIPKKVPERTKIVGDYSDLSKCGELNPRGQKMDVAERKANVC